MIPLLAGFCIAAVASPLGTFIVWRKMAYFGDTLAHASLLGLAFGFLLHLNIYLSLIACCLLIAFILVILERKSTVSTDTLLGIIAHSALSLGLVCVSLIDNLRVDLMNYLFGDLLSVSIEDLAGIIAICIFILILLIKYWTPLLAITVNEEMAAVDGYPVEKLKMILMLMIGLMIAISMKFVGALIITSLMLIPAATAKRFSSSPERMAILASLFGMLSVIGGLVLSWFKDTPTGPSIVVIAGLLFFITQYRKQIK